MPDTLYLGDQFLVRFDAGAFSSCIIRTVLSWTLGEKLLDFLLFMAPPSQSKEPPRFPVRFTQAGYFHV
jgi:hypothetical protein